MTRRLLNLLTALSLLLCVLLTAACIRSHLVYREWVRWGEATGMVWHHVVLRLGRGQVGIALTRRNHLPPVPEDVASKINDENGSYRTDGVKYGQVEPVYEMRRHVDSFWRRRGFYFHFRRDHSPSYLFRDADSTYHKQPTVETTLIVDTPYWPLLLSTAALPTVRVAVACRHRRAARSGRCPCCGCSLTGNLSGVCPECGTAKG